MKKFFCLAVIFSVLLSVFTVFSCASPESDDFPDTSKADAVALYNLETDRVVYEKNIEKKLFPAGVAKMMTGILACEILSQRQEEIILISEEMLSGAAGAGSKLKIGMSVTVQDLLYCVLCGGGNDASLVIARLCGGDIEGFVRMMNEKAKELGLSNTHFTNPTGIDDPDMYSTLSDILILAKYAQKNKLYLDISSAASYVYTPIGDTHEIKIFNRNSLISTYYALGYRNRYAYGLTVGDTELGGHCVITYAERNDTGYICAVMGGVVDDKNIYSYDTVNSLLSHAFENYVYTKIASQGTEICSVTASLAMPSGTDDEASVPCIIKDNVYALVNDDIDLSKDIKYRYYIHNQPLKAPVSAGIVIGGVDILYEGEVIGEAKLVTSKRVEASGILLFLDNLKDFFISRVFIFSVLFFILIFGVYYITVISKYSRKYVKINHRRIK